MKRLLFFFTLVLIFTMPVYGQFPAHVHAIDVQTNAMTAAEGDLADGALMEDLSWASTSSNACFPATQNLKFRGNHVLYGFSIPPYSEVTITLIPTDKQANFSLYGYQVGTTNFSTPPDLASCVSCEADHKWDYPKRGQTQDHTRSIYFNSIKNPYNIFIGVAGAEGLTKGTFRLEIDLKSLITYDQPQEALKRYSMAVAKGESKRYAGSLADGVKVGDLSWAANSSVACFPATQNQKFTGNHVIYETEIPPRSVMTITLIPKDPKANFSLYAYQTGTTSEVLPPALSSCVSCEADHKWDYPKRGKTQDHTRSVQLNAIQNPYRVVIGVVGAEGLTEGDFELEVKVE